MGGLSGAKRRKARKQSRKAVCARRLPFICHGYSTTNVPFLKVFLYTRAIVYSLFINFRENGCERGMNGVRRRGQAGSARRTKRVGGRGTAGAWRSHGRQGTVGAVTEEDGGRERRERDSGGTVRERRKRMTGDGGENYARLGSGYNGGWHTECGGKGAGGARETRGRGGGGARGMGADTRREDGRGRGAEVGESRRQTGAGGGRAQATGEGAMLRRQKRRILRPWGCIFALCVVG